ncbi:MAG TPA: hypothetical protein VHD83_08485 [Puia sp.]|nr:hypothetical protein [Puia sp.]
MADKSLWKPNIENIDNITIEDIKFIHFQAEKRLDHTIRIADSIANKTTILTSVLTGIIISLTGYIISQSEIFGNSKTTIAFLALICAFCIAFSLLKNILPTNFNMSGTQPQNLFIDDFFTDKFRTEEYSKDRPTVHLYMAVIRDYQNRIDENEGINTEKWKRYIFCIKALIFMPLVLGIIYSIWG